MDHAHDRGHKDAPPTHSSARDKGKTPATIEAIATPSDDDHFADSPNITIMSKKKMKQINLEVMRILYEANPTEEMLMRLSELRALALRYQDFMKSLVPGQGQCGEAGTSRPSDASGHQLQETPPSQDVHTRLPSAMSATRAMQTSTPSQFMGAGDTPATPFGTPDTDQSTCIGDNSPSFPGSTRVSSTGVMQTSLLIDNNESMPLKCPKIPGNDTFYKKFYDLALHIFGPTIRRRWNLQEKKLKDQLVKDLEHEFGNNIFDEKKILERAAKHLKTVRDAYRKSLIQNPKYERPPFISVRDWNEFILDAKEKADAQRGITPTNARRLQDTSMATKARLQKIGQHRFGSGGYSKIKARIGSDFNLEATEEHKKIAFKEGYRAMADRLRQVSTGPTEESSASCAQPNLNRDTDHTPHHEAPDVHRTVQGEDTESCHAERVPEDVQTDHHVDHVAHSADPLLAQQPLVPEQMRRRHALELQSVEQGNDEDMDLPLRNYTIKQNKGLNRVEKGVKVKKPKKK